MEPLHERGLCQRPVPSNYRQTELRPKRQIAPVTKSHRGVVELYHLRYERFLDYARCLRSILLVDPEALSQRWISHPPPRDEAQAGVLVARPDAVLRVHVRQL